MIDRYDIQALQQQAGSQPFDRKNFHMKPKALAVIAVAFANADWGDIVIVESMREYKLVKEFGEGVDRMFREMSEVGNPSPEYKQVEFMVKVKQTSALREDDETVEKITRIIKENPTITIKELSLLLSLTRRGVEEQIKSLRAKGIIRRVGPDIGGHWEVVEQKEKGGA